MKSHPMQNIIIDDKGTVRFKENKVISYLLKHHTNGLNDLYMQDFSKKDMEQFCQQIGYSVSGFGDLAIARKKTVAKADKKAEKIIEDK